MKKERNHIILCLLLVFSASCTRNVTEDWVGKMVVFQTPHYLGVSSSSVLFDDGNGGKQTLGISSTSTSWEIRELPEWLTADKKEGEGSASVTITCSVNPSGKAARAAVFYVCSKEKDWDYQLPVSVSQIRSMSYVIPAETTVSFEAKESRQAISVNSNVDDWSVTASASWLTAGKSDDGMSVDINVTANPNNTSRTAYVILKTEDEEKQITVIQRAGNISATLDKLTYEHEAGSQKVTITSDAPWTAQTASSWIEAVPSSAGAGTTEVSVRTLANNSFDTRSGYVYFVMADDNKVELPVEQGAITFSLSVSSLAFSHSASTKTVTINTNAEWEMISDLPDWLTVSKREGKGNTDMEVSAKEYLSESVSPRYATLFFKPKTIDRNFDVAVSQTGQELDLNTTALQFTNKSASQFLSFTATGKWTITTSATWITVTPTSGTGDATCTVTVEENTGDERTGEVLISFFEETYRIPITQQGSYLTLSTKGLQFGSIGGSLRIDIASNIRWDAAVKDNVSWLDVNPKSGEDNDVLTITVSDNPSADGRNGEVLVTPQDRTPLLVSVAQAARYLNISTNSIDILASGGTSELITVDTDGTFEVTTGSDWLTINKVGEKSFTVTASANDSFRGRTSNIKVSITNLIAGSIEQNLLVTQKGLSNDFPFTLTTADGLPEQTSAAATAFSKWVSPTYMFDEPVSSFRLTVTHTSPEDGYNTSTNGGRGYIFFTMGEFYLYDAAGKQVELTADNFYGNATELPDTNDGVIGNLCDGDESTHYHTMYSATLEPRPIGQEYYLEVTLPEPMQSFSFGFAKRSNNANIPCEIIVTKGGEDADPYADFGFQLGEKVTSIEPGGLYVFADEGQITSDAWGENAGMTTWLATGKDPRYASPAGTDKYYRIRRTPNVDCIFEAVYADEGEFYLKSYLGGTYIYGANATEGSIFVVQAASMTTAAKFHLDEEGYLVCNNHYYTTNSQETLVAYDHPVRKLSIFKVNVSKLSF